MFTLILAVQRYNFFLENKIFPFFFQSKVPVVTHFTEKTPLLYEHTLEIALEARLVNVTALLRMDLRMGKSIV